jgi:hypothetical protein
MTSIQVQAQIVLRSATKTVLLEKPGKASLSAQYAVMVNGKELSYLSKNAEIDIETESFTAATELIKEELGIV